MITVGDETFSIRQPHNLLAFLRRVRLQADRTSPAKAGSSLAKNARSGSFPDMSARRVAVLGEDFLPFSQTFVFEELRLLQRYRADVFAWRRLNEALFPYRTVYVRRFSLSPYPIWPRVSCGVSGRSRMSSLAHSRNIGDLRIALRLTLPAAAGCHLSRRRRDGAQQLGRDFCRIAARRMRSRRRGCSAESTLRPLCLTGDSRIVFACWVPQRIVW